MHHPSLHRLERHILPLNCLHWHSRFQSELETRLEAAKNSLNDNEPVPDVPADTVTAQKTTPEKPARNASRKPLPAGLPREIQTLLPADSVCPSCGGELKVMGETLSEQLEIINTAFKVIETVRPNLAFTRCDVIVQAPLPVKPVEDRRVGPHPGRQICGAYAAVPAV